VLEGRFERDAVVVGPRPNPLVVVEHRRTLRRVLSQASPVGPIFGRELAAEPVSACCWITPRKPSTGSEAADART